MGSLVHIDASLETNLGVNKIARVMARLIIKEEARGMHVLHPHCNTREPYPGILSIGQPLRSGASPLNYSTTRLHNVKLPPTTLLSDAL